MKKLVRLTAQTFPGRSRRFGLCAVMGSVFIYVVKLLERNLFSLRKRVSRPVFKKSLSKMSIPQRIDEMIQ
jgi:hypothetical protein